MLRPHEQRGLLRVGVRVGDRIVSAGTNKVKAGSEIDAVEPQTAVTKETTSPVSPAAEELREDET
jgi:hypothetical protein